jgi:hypothetical protein
MKLLSNVGWTQMAKWRLMEGPWGEGRDGKMAGITRGTLYIFDREKRILSLGMCNSLCVTL